MALQAKKRCFRKVKAGAKVNNGALIISLDFELFWGILDCEDYRKNLERLLHTRTVVSQLIEIFEKNELRVTWSTVGLLMLAHNEDLKNLKTMIKTPGYTDQQLNNYKKHHELLDENNYCDRVFFANDLVKQLRDSRYQTVGTHTFSHYYCLEDGQTLEEFDSDLSTAIRIAEKNDLNIRSIVFPRNQYDTAYLNLLKNHTIDIYRGNPDHYIYKTRKKDNLFIRGLHLIDAYFNIAGPMTHPMPKADEGLYNIKASRFLRPISQKTLFLKKLQLRRIKNEMTYAAKKNEYYHLWWHPHNFSRFTKENFEFLQEIITHFNYLNEVYGFTTESMESYVKKVKAYG